MNYSCTIFGDLRVPYFELHGNVKRPYSGKEIICKPIFLKGEEESFEIPDFEVKSFKDRLVEAKRKEAESQGRTLFDGPMVRLKDYSVDDELHLLNLELQRTSFFTFTATNKSIDNPEVRRMVDERGPSYTNLNDGLANPIGVNVVLISEPDNAIVITKRSEKLAQYPGLYGVPAGFMNPDKDRLHFKEQDSPVKDSELGSVAYPEKFFYAPTITGEREVKEEMGVPIIESSAIELGRAGDDKHLEFSMVAKTPYTKEKILSAPKTSKWETQQINIVPFEPKEVMKYLVETVKEEPKGVPKGTGVWIPGKSPAWVPAQWEAVKAHLISEFDFDEVWNAYEETRRNH